jgi:hypothetical protein
MTRGPTPEQTAWGGVAWCGAYLLAIFALPAPGGVDRVLRADVFLLVPALFATAAAWTAARAARGGERAFWLLLGAATAANSASQVLFAAHEAWRPDAVALRMLAHLGYYAYVVLLTVALMARPERPRTLRRARAASIEWLIAFVLGYFLILYFVMLPDGAAQRPWYLVLVAQEAFPALGALWLAAHAAASPFRRVYRILAVGFTLGALCSAYPNWLYTRGQYQVYSPWDIAWLLPVLAVAVAARTAPASGWLRAPWPAAPIDTAPPLAAAAAAVRTRGVALEEVSVGSTPTARAAMGQEGVTECRPGNYVYHDGSQVALGTCGEDECALTVLATVVSVPAPGRAVLDAGSKTLSSDPLRPRANGFGLVLGTHSRLSRLSEEHGVVEVAEGDSFRVGQKVRVLPNHACVVSNLHDRVMVVSGEAVVDEWAVAARGRVL